MTIATSPFDRLLDLHDRLAELEQERERLLRDGLAPESAWIECEKVHKRNWRQAKWKAETPIFNGKKTRYIGGEGSEKHKRAQSLYQNRKAFDRVTKEINQIQEVLDRD